MPSRPAARRARKPRRSAALPAGPARERILAAALEVFAERGFEGARTREIAERAGANLGLITYYFGTKEPLWKAAVSQAFEDLAREFAVVTASARDGAAKDERAQLEHLLRGFVRFLARRPEFMRLMNDESRRDGPRMRWLADHHVKPMGEVLSRVVERAAARGLVPSIPPASLRYIVIGAAGLLFSQAPECRYLLGIDPADEAVVEAHADALVRLLLGPARRSR